MKKEQSYLEAISSFRVAANGLTGNKRIIALEELAKLYEHKLKELNQALQFTRDAQRLLNVDLEIAERFRNRQLEELKFGK